ncbi:VSPHA protease, partial [Calyptomena viridis]|nr:VSPHA protease [Calyptomena viridis]
RAGEHSLAQVTGHEQFAVAVEVAVHPEFQEDPELGNSGNSGNRSHDLMLLRVEPPFTWTEQVRPLPLPTEPPEVGTSCTVMGWGTTTSPE